MAAFGPAGISVDLASPATPEAVFWAVEQARAAEGAHVLDRAPGVRPEQPDADAPAMRPYSERVQRVFSET